MPCRGEKLSLSKAPERDLSLRGPPSKMELLAVPRRDLEPLELSQRDLWLCSRPSKTEQLALPPRDLAPLRTPPRGLVALRSRLVDRNVHHTTERKKMTHQSRKLDVLGEEGLIGERLFRSQETQVLRGNVRCREGSAIVSVLENNTDSMSGLRQLCDDACGCC